MKIGVVGLGRMGCGIATRLLAAKHEVIGFDVEAFARNNAILQKIPVISSLEELVKETSIVLVMVPAGSVVDAVLESLSKLMRKGDIIIDGGNSNFRDTIRRAKRLAGQGIVLLDCGTSGGIHGQKQGYSLMIGGEKSSYERALPIFQALAADGGFLYCGPSGAGHYVKMVHNGIEYSLLQAYAEGFHLLKENKEYPALDLAAIANVWLHGSIIRSWILTLCCDIFLRDQSLQKISGEIGENLTGQWTLQEATSEGVPMHLLASALAVRANSRKTGGNFGTKVVAMLRKEFGGHATGKEK